MSKKTENFEASMSQLEELMEKLEDPNTPLETIVETYAEGQKLLKICQKRLEAAELKLEEATADGGTKPSEA